MYVSYSIIRNEKYNRSSLIGLYRHNERKNTTYSNKNINHEKTFLNYSLKKCDNTYLQQFEQIREEYNLQGWIKKNSNVVCEYIITSDEEYFESIGKNETKRFFETAYEFVKNYKNLGENYILSANVHLDEATPHMHLIYIPVIHTFDNKTGKTINKICCSEFWKGKESYKYLQDNFYKYMIRAGFELERGDTKGNQHIKIEDLKKITNYEMQEMFKETSQLEKELIKVLDKKKIPYYSCIKELNINDNKLYFLNNGNYDNENDNSSIIYTKLNNYKFLFMGDAGVEVEEDLIRKYNLQNIDVLKVGHHGSKTSSSVPFINEINPKYSIISVGKNNRYGHPNDNVLNILDDSKIYRTDQDGSILFKIKNNKLKVEICPP